MESLLGFKLDFWDYATGRVAPEWSVTTLHFQMKHHAGVGLRGMVKRLVGRLDLAHGEKGAGAQMMLGQSF